MDINPLNTQVVVDLQEEGTQNLLLQDKEGQILHIIPSVPWFEGCEPPQSSEVETKEAELQQLLAADSEPVKEGRVDSIASNKHFLRVLRRTPKKCSFNIHSQ